MLALRLSIDDYIIEYYVINALTRISARRAYNILSIETVLKIIVIGSYAIDDNFLSFERFLRISGINSEA